MRERKPKVIKKKDVDAELDRVRSIEINMLRELIRRYPQKAQDIVGDLTKNLLTKQIV